MDLELSKHFVHIKLPGINCVKYSQLKLDRWRKRRAPSKDTPEASPRKTQRERVKEAKWTHV